MEGLDADAASGASFFVVFGFLVGGGDDEAAAAAPPAGANDSVETLRLFFGPRFGFLEGGPSSSKVGDGEEARALLVVAPRTLRRVADGAICRVVVVGKEQRSNGGIGENAVGRNDGSRTVRKELTTGWAKMDQQPIHAGQPLQPLPHALARRVVARLLGPVLGVPVLDLRHHVAVDAHPPR